MYATGYPLSRLRTRRPSMIELAIGVAVIAGLAFVTIRIKNMPPPPAQTIAQSAPAVLADTNPAVRADANPPVPAAGETKTP
jgi:hypothetical protein